MKAENHKLKHILLLNLSYPPDNTATANIVRDLAQAIKEKYRLTILCGRPSYNPDEHHPYYLLRRERYRNLTIERVGSTSFDRRWIIKRCCNYITYLTLSFLRALTMSPRPNLVLSMSDPPLISIIAAIIALLRRSKFVYNIRDLYPDVPIALGLLKPRWLGNLWERLHRWSLRRADLIIVLGEDMKEHIVAKGISPAKVAVVRDGSKALEQPTTLEHPTVKEIRRGFPFVVAYAGNIGYSGAWETLIKALSKLEGEDIGFAFVGDGVWRSLIEREARKLNNVWFLPLRPKDEIPYVLSSADLHIVTIRKGLEGLVVPSKLYPILMMGKPVLAVAPQESDIARIVERHRCGLVVDPEEPEAVANAILWARNNQQELAEMGRRAKEASHLFEQEKKVKEFVQVLESVMS